MSQAPPVVYQETRLSPAPNVASHILEINTTGQPQPTAFGAGRKRGFDEISGLDEESYARKHLATEGSVFFRQKATAPRNFLWRVLDDSKVLEVQSVDLVHDKAAKSESWLTFRITLPNAIVKNGVALGDPVEVDALEIYVLTTNNDLYTFTLKRDLLTRETAPSDFDAKTCFKKYTSNSLAFRHPYRFVAVSSFELLISLHDGGLMRLHRQAKDTGAQWRETFFSEGGWSGTLRGLIPLKRHQTIPYGDIELEPSAIVAMAKSPDGKYIWTVSLDHELRAWSTQTGKKVSQTDILGGGSDEERRKQQKYVMGGEQGTLLQIVKMPPSPTENRVARRDETQDEPYCLILHSPRDHQFKFYGITHSARPEEGDIIDARDLIGSQTLIPPIDAMMNTNIWHLEEFYLLPGSGWKDTKLWLRARSGTLCQIFTISFDIFTEGGALDDLEASWQSGWMVVDGGMQTVDAIRGSIDFPGDLEDFTRAAITPSEKWLDFLFKPGRFSTTSIETALHIYRKGRGLLSGPGGRGLNTSGSPLKEHLTQAITSKIILRRSSGDQPDYRRYQSDIQAQWRIFFSLLAHLHARRNETIGFALDLTNNLPWTIGTDFVAPIRENNLFENVYLNAHIVPDDKLQLVEETVANKVFPASESPMQSVLLAAAMELYNGMSADFKERFSSNVFTEALTSDLSDGVVTKQRIQALYEENNISEEVMDDSFQALQNATDILGGLGSITADFLIGVLELLDSKSEGKRRDDKALNRYGDKLIVTIAQESLDRQRQQLLAILNLVVFMHGDLEQDELDPDFADRISEVYDGVMGRIKNNELLSWLARNEISEPTRQGRSSRSADTQTPETETVTLLERIAIGDWNPRSNGGETFPELLTTWSKQWTFGADLVNEWDGVTGFILSFLIKEQLFDLASKFQTFITKSEDLPSWTKYLQGRLFLATGDYALASLKFRMAAVDMAQADHIGTADSVHLLSAEERNYFGQGQTAFFQHVAALFEKLKAWSYTAEAASHALDCLETGMDASRIYEQDRRWHDPDSSEVEIIDAVMEQQRLLSQGGSVREELLSRLFNALLQTGRFREAFDALQNLNDLPVKRSELKKLLDACVKQDAVQDLLDLPFEEANLVEEADAVLLSLVKKEFASTSTGGPLFYQILYAFRTQRADFRGAAELLYEHLERLRHAQHKHGMQDPEDNTLIDAYVLLINTMACCGENDAWLLADPVEDVHAEGVKRRLVKIADVRREYAAELDKRSDILQGRFPLVATDGDVMDVL